MITKKLLFDRENIKILIAKDLNLLKGIFLMRKMSKFLAARYNFPPSPGSPLKVQGKSREQSTPEGCKKFLTLLVKREIPGI